MRGRNLTCKVMLGIGYLAVNFLLSTGSLLFMVSETLPTTLPLSISSTEGQPLY